MSVELKVWVRLFGDCYWLLVYRELGRVHIFPDSPPSRLSTAPWRDLAEMGSFMLEFQSNGNVSVHQRFGTDSFAPWRGVGHTPDCCSRQQSGYAFCPLSRGDSAHSPLAIYHLPSTIYHLPKQTALHIKRHSFIVFYTLYR